MAVSVKSCVACGGAISLYECANSHSNKSNHINISSRWSCCLHICFCNWWFPGSPYFPCCSDPVVDEVSQYDEITCGSEWVTLQLPTWGKGGPISTHTSRCMGISKRKTAHISQQTARWGITGGMIIDVWTSHWYEVHFIPIIIRQSLPIQCNSSS